MLRLAVIFSAIVLLFDVVWALIAKSLAINWGTSLILSAVVYVVLGVYAGGQLRSFQRALVAIAIAAFVDWTLGWYIAWIIGPGLTLNNPTLLELIFAVVVGTLYGTSFGGLGAFFGARAARASL